jgi:hypothetical protein
MIWNEYNRHYTQTSERLKANDMLCSKTRQRCLRFPVVRKKMLQRTTFLYNIKNEQLLIGNVGGTYSSQLALKG